MEFLPGTGARVPDTEPLLLQESESKDVYTASWATVCCLSAGCKTI